MPILTPILTPHRLTTRSRRGQTKRSENRMRDLVHSIEVRFPEMFTIRALAVQFAQERKDYKPSFSAFEWYLIDKIGSSHNLTHHDGLSRWERQSWRKEIEKIIGTIQAPGKFVR